MFGNPLQPKKKGRTKSEPKGERTLRPGEEREGLLRGRRLAVDSMIVYQKWVCDFLLWCPNNGYARLDTTHAGAVDKALDRFLVDLFLKKLPASDAQDAYYAVRWRFCLTNVDLRLANASLKGFKKKNPDEARDPLTWAGTVLISHWLARSGESDGILAACAVLLDFDTYARPGALLKLTRADLLEPITSLGVDDDKPPVTATHQNRSKGRTQDNTVVVGFGHRKWIRKLCHILKRRLDFENDILFQLKPQRCHALFKKAVNALGLPTPCVPHMLRHDGASKNASGGASKAEIQSRGKWQDPRDIIANWGLTAGQRDDANVAEEWLMRHLSGALRHLPKPGTFGPVLKSTNVARRADSSTSSSSSPSSLASCSKRPASSASLSPRNRLAKKKASAQDVGDSLAASKRDASLSIALRNSSESSMSSWCRDTSVGWLQRVPRRLQLAPRAEAKSKLRSRKEVAPPPPRGKRPSSSSSHDSKFVPREKLAKANRRGVAPPSPSDGRKPFARTWKKRNGPRGGAKHKKKGE